MYDIIGEGRGGGGGCIYFFRKENTRFFQNKTKILLQF